MKPAFIVIGLLSILIPYPAQAEESTISLIVPPVHYLVVDEDMQVVLVATNTGDTPEPIVYLGSDKGRKIPYSAQIRKHYFALHPLIDFSYTGVVYGPLEAQDKSSWWGNIITGLSRLFSP